MMRDVATKLRSSGYWILTILTALLFAIPGAALLAQVPHFVGEMAHLGYPGYFLTILGVWKVLGAAAILVAGLPRVKEWAYAGMMFDATSAAASRAAVGDGAITVIGAIAIAALVAGSWALRPEERKLKAS
jgi:uncharacterized membrane protein YphA (DoxX/SURF4 family)